MSSFYSHLTMIASAILASSVTLVQSNALYYIDTTLNPPTFVDPPMYANQLDGVSIMLYGMHGLATAANMQDYQSCMPTGNMMFPDFNIPASSMTQDAMIIFDNMTFTGPIYVMSDDMAECMAGMKFVVNVVAQGAVMGGLDPGMMTTSTSSDMGGMGTGMGGGNMPTTSMMMGSGSSSMMMSGSMTTKTVMTGSSGSMMMSSMSTGMMGNAMNNSAMSSSKSAATTTSPSSTSLVASMMAGFLGSVMLMLTL